MANAQRAVPKTPKETIIVRSHPKRTSIWNEINQAELNHPDFSLVEIDIAAYYNHTPTPYTTRENLMKLVHPRQRPSV